LGVDTPGESQPGTPTALARAVEVKVIAYRAEHGLSQTASAKRLKMTQPAVARLERGGAQPGVPGAPAHLRGAWGRAPRHTVYRRTRICDPELRGVPRRHQGSHPQRAGTGCESDQRGAHRGVLADRSRDPATPTGGGPGAGPPDTGGGAAVIGRSAGGISRISRVLRAQPLPHASIRGCLARSGRSLRPCERPSLGTCGDARGREDPDVRDWYVQRAGAWSHEQLQTAIASRLHEREGAAITNFGR
jgi:hypothetical protein